MIPLQEGVSASLGSHLSAPVAHLPMGGLLLQSHLSLLLELVKMGLVESLVCLEFGVKRGRQGRGFAGVKGRGVAVLVGCEELRRSLGLELLVLFVKDLHTLAI